MPSSAKHQREMTDSALSLEQRLSFRMSTGIERIRSMYLAGQVLITTDTLDSIRTRSLLSGHSAPTIAINS